MSTYQSLTPLSRDDALEMMSSSDTRVAGEAILRLALHDPDGGWVTDRALELLNNSAPEVRITAATALGHVARIHRSIDQARVVPALRRLLDDPATAGRAEDALDDIEVFANPHNGSATNADD
ncbi:HEAT repeat domain-containing protein [Nocardia vaccinii]|uniref:HEAT repeat domain-containing protein n=1 Tax=Nocardia vaccinii TaxID=1822 RepID=UPI001472630A|nr:HEAT repeat domain-containing protein [Nocardia vaccinii]